MSSCATREPGTEVQPQHLDGERDGEWDGEWDGGRAPHYGVRPRDADAGVSLAVRGVLCDDETDRQTKTYRRL